MRPDSDRPAVEQICIGPPVSQLNSIWPWLWAVGMIWGLNERMPKRPKARPDA